MRICQGETIARSSLVRDDHHVKQLAAPRDRPVQLFAISNTVPRLSPPKYLSIIRIPLRPRSKRPKSLQFPSYSKDFVLSRPISRCSSLVPSFLYASEPAKRKASQIRATLCPSRAAIVSSPIFKSDRTLKVRRVSFFIRKILAPDRYSHYCASRSVIDISSIKCHPFVILLSFVVTL
jgi:hypothetical protein